MQIKMEGSYTFTSFSSDDDQSFSPSSSLLLLLQNIQVCISILISLSERPEKNAYISPFREHLSLAYDKTSLSIH